MTDMKFIEVTRMEVPYHNWKHAFAGQSLGSGQCKIYIVLTAIPINTNYL